MRAKIVAAAPSGSVTGLDGAIEDALLKAHDFSSDIDAWSAVFVGSCVRAAAIKLKLEGVVGGRHEGKDGLLTVSFRHAEYVAAARGRKKGRAGRLSRVRAEGPRDQERRHHRHRSRGRSHDDDPGDVGGLAGRRNLHCDIVCDVKTGGTQPFAETVGGNVTHTARRRRYPLTRRVMLVVSPSHFFIQEDDNGQFPCVQSAGDDAVGPEAAEYRADLRLS